MLTRGALRLRTRVETQTRIGTLRDLRVRRWIASSREIRTAATSTGTGTREEGTAEAATRGIPGTAEPPRHRSDPGGATREPRGLPFCEPRSDIFGKEHFDSCNRPQGTRRLDKLGACQQSCCRAPQDQAERANGDVRLSSSPESIDIDAHLTSGRRSCYICTPTLTPSSQPIEFAVGFRDDRIAAKDAPDILVECIVDGVVVKHEEVVIRALKDDKAARNAQSMRGRTWTWRGRRESKVRFLFTLVSGRYRSRDSIDDSICQTAIRPFVFSPLKLTEDEDLACSSESIIRQLGTIQLRIFRGKVGTAAKAVGDDGYRTGIEAVQDMRFEETSAKVKGGAVSHQAGSASFSHLTGTHRDASSFQV